MKQAHNWIDLSKYLPVLVIILIVFLALPISYYFLYALPHFNQQKLEIEREKLAQNAQEEERKLKVTQEKELEATKISQQKLDLEREKLAQERKKETEINNNKNKIISEHQAKIDWCENAKAKLIAGFTWSSIDSQNLLAISQECDRLREEYGL